MSSPSLREPSNPPTSGSCPSTRRASARAAEQVGVPVSGWTASGMTPRARARAHVGGVEGRRVDLHAIGDPSAASRVPPLRGLHETAARAQRARRRARDGGGGARRGRTKRGCCVAAAAAAGAPAAPLLRHGSAEEALRAVYGYDAFRGVQADAIAAALAGEDALVVMATGGGKSLCYQVPPLVLGRPALVVSPLVSLMQDQVLALQARGVAACVLGSAQADDTLWRRLGDFQFVYVTPERAATGRLRDAAAAERRASSRSTRPTASPSGGTTSAPSTASSTSCARRAKLRGVPLMAVTATAAPRARRRLRQPRAARAARLVLGVDRPNLVYTALPAKNLDAREREVRAVRRGAPSSTCSPRARRRTPPRASRAASAGPSPPTTPRWSARRATRSTATLSATPCPPWSPRSPSGWASTSPTCASSRTTAPPRHARVVLPAGAARGARRRARALRPGARRRRLAAHAQPPHARRRRGDRRARARRPARDARLLRPRRGRSVHAARRSPRTLATPPSPSAAARATSAARPSARWARAPTRPPPRARCSRSCASSTRGTALATVLDADAAAPPRRDQRRALRERACHGAGAAHPAALLQAVADCVPRARASSRTRCASRGRASSTRRPGSPRRARRGSPTPTRRSTSPPPTPRPRRRAYRAAAAAAAAARRARRPPWTPRTPPSSSGSAPRASPRPTGSRPRWCARTPPSARSRAASRATRPLFDIPGIGRHRRGLWRRPPRGDRAAVRRRARERGRGRGREGAGGGERGGRRPRSSLSVRVCVC